MTRQKLRSYCLQKEGAVECYPYGDCVKAYKLNGKMFAFFRTDETFTLSIKSDPKTSAALRKKYPKQVEAGFWNMQKKHWNTVRVQGPISSELILELVDESYDLIAKRK